MPTLAHALAVMHLRTDFHDASAAGHFYAARRMVERLEAALSRPAREIPADAAEVTDAMMRLRAASVCSSASFKAETHAIRRAIGAVLSIPEDALERARLVAGKPDPTLADAIVAAEVQDWADKSRVAETLRRIARYLKRAPEDIPARLSDLDEPVLKTLTAADLGVSSANTVTVMRSRARAAIRLVDRAHRRFTFRDLEGPWADLYAELRAAIDAEALSGSVLGELRPLIEFCFRAAIEPQQVGDAAIALWCDKLRQGSVHDWKSKVRKAIHRWNNLVGANTVASFPRRTLSTVDLSVAPVCRPYETLNESCRRSWQAFCAAHRPPPSATALLDRLLGDDPDEPATRDDAAVEAGILERLFAEDDEAKQPSPARPRILSEPYLATLRWYLCQAYSALLAKGKPESALDSVKAVLGYEGFHAALKAIGQRMAERADKAGKPLGITLSFIVAAYRLQTIAIGAGVDPAGLNRINDKIKEIKAERARGPKRVSKMGPSHQAMLRQFNSPAAILRWHDRPTEIYRQVMARLGAVVDGRIVIENADRSLINKDLCAAMEAAVVMLIEQNIPLRRGNVGKTRHKGDRPNLTMPRRAGEEGWLHYNGAETKTGIAIKASVDWDTAQVLRAWIEVFLPWKCGKQAVDPANVHLFPKRGLAHKALTGITDNVRTQYRKVGLDLDLHIHRHIAGKLILMANPSGIELLARLLGHTSAETARQFYAEEIDPYLAQIEWQKILKSEIERLRSKPLLPMAA